MKKFIKQIFNIYDFEPDQIDEIISINRILFLKILLFIGIIIFAAFAVISFNKEIYDIAVFDSLGVVSLISLIVYIRRTKNSLLAAYLVMMILGLHFLYLLYKGGMGNFGYIWTFLFPLGAILFFQNRKGLIVTFIFLALAIIILLNFSVYTQFGSSFLLRYLGVYLTITIVASSSDFIRGWMNYVIIKKNESLKKALEKAEEADRLKSHFLAQVSHEIRTPVNTIVNYNSLIESELRSEQTNEFHDWFESIRRATNRLTRTIDLILNISAVEPGSYDPKFEKTDLVCDIILPVVKEFKPSAEQKNLSIIFKNGFEKTEIMVDRYSMIQAVTNLVHNAVKYTQTGHIIVGINIIENKLQLYVKDTGIGISKEYLPHIFEKFHRKARAIPVSMMETGLVCRL